MSENEVGAAPVVADSFGVDVSDGAELCMECYCLFPAQFIGEHSDWHNYMAFQISGNRRYLAPGDDGAIKYA